MMRQLVTHPCEDACGEITTDRTVEGAPVYRCPGCDSEWIELNERTARPVDSPSAHAQGGTLHARAEDVPAPPSSP